MCIIPLFKNSYKRNDHSAKTPPDHRPQGRETPYKKNTVLLFMKEDGTLERMFEAEERNNLPLCPPFAGR